MFSVWLIGLDDAIRASSPLAMIAPSTGVWAIDSAVEAAALMHDTTLIKASIDELPLLEWLPLLTPRALARWHEPRVSISVIAHRRPASLHRLLDSLGAAYYLGDSNIRLSFAIDGGADDETIALARGYVWDNGPTPTVHARAGHAGLIAAVVESWTPASGREYGLLLEDDIEVRAD